MKTNCRKINDDILFQKMPQNRYFIIQGIIVSNINEEEMDNHGRTRIEGYSNLIFDKHNHEVVECINQHSK